MPQPLHIRLTKLFSTAILLLALTDLHASAQPPKGMNHQAWSTEDGLPQNSVHQILQSKDGYIWIATESGVARFDGFNFKLFHHESDPAFTSDDICCITQDASDTLWFGTADGLILLRNGKAQRLSSQQGAPTSPILTLTTDDNGALIVLTAENILLSDQDHLSPIALPNQAHATAIGKNADGSLWIATTSTLFRYTHNNLSPIAVAPSIATEAILGVVSAGDGTLWLRTNNSVLSIHASTQHIWTAGKQLPGTRINSLSLDAAGTAWIGTNRGLVTIGTVTIDATTKLTPIPDLASNSILSTLSDHEGNRWIGTESTGLHVLRERKFSTLPALSDQVVTALAETTDHTIWIGTRDQGIRRYRSGITDKSIDEPIPATALASPVILSIAAGTNNDLWVGTADGLNHIESTHVQKLTSEIGLPDDFIRSLLVDPDGSLWIGTRRGLAHLQNGHVSTITRTDGLGSDLIGALLHDSSQHSGDLWVGTYAGLSHLHAGNITNYTTKDGLTGNIITALARDTHGTLWIGTNENGLNRYTTQGIVTFPQSALPENITALTIDAQNYLWLRSKDGIVRVSIDDLNHCANISACPLQISHFDHHDGMPSEEAPPSGHPTVLNASDGTLWFATRKGVAIVDPMHMPQNTVTPLVAIESFTIDDVDTPPLAGEIELGAGHTRFAFNYIGLSYTVPQKVQYRYMLEGFDHNWIAAGTRRTAYYTNLPPGHYSFHVQASNNDGMWSTTDATILFHITPPFYRRLWFYAVLALLIATIVYLLYRLRVRRLQSQFNAVLAERNRIAREIHDTLAQDFVGVSLQLEVAAQFLNRENLPAASEQINRTRKLVRDGIADARQSIWDLRATTATDSLPTRLTHLVDRATSATLSTNLQIGGTYRKLAPSFENEILRIAQEALANVTHHAHATAVTVELRYTPDTLVLRIADDGQGFDVRQAAERQGHYGLQGMHERSAVISAQLTVESEAGKGTTVTLAAPTPK